MTPYRYCVKRWLVEGRWWWCPGYYDDKGLFRTVGYRLWRRDAQRDADLYNQKAQQGRLRI